MKRTVILGGGAVVIVGVGLAFGRPGGDRPPGPPNGPPHGPGHIIVAALDVDRDGVVSAEELAAASTSLLALDDNGDGVLTSDELGGGRPGEGGPPPPDDGRGGPRGLMRLDADGDGVVTLEEFLAPPSEHFGELDTNADGVIDEAETEAAPPPPPPPHGPWRVGHGHGRGRN